MAAALGGIAESLEHRQEAGSLPFVLTALISQGGVSSLLTALLAPPSLRLQTMAERGELFCQVGLAKACPMMH